MKIIALVQQKGNSLEGPLERTESAFNAVGIKVVRYRDGREAAKVVSESDADFVAFVDPGTVPRADLKPMIEAAQNGFAMVYSDYVENDRVEKLFDPVYEIHERFNYGRFRLYSRRWIDMAGGLNPIFFHAIEYDLRLKIQEEHGGRFFHVAEPLFNSIPKSETIKTDKLMSKSFGYLFYPPEEEREYEKAFKDMLKRVGAFLDGEYEVAHDNLKHEYKATVLIPVLNRVKFIGYAIKSVLAQTMQDFEIIVVDNGSTDGTQDVVRSFDDPRIKLIQNSGGTIAYALNTGIRAAKGQYISQLDSDDVYLPETLEFMTSALDDDPYAGLAISYYELMDSEGNPMPEFGVITHLEYDRNNILRVEGAGAVRTWRRATLLRMGLFDEPHYGNYGEDYDMVLKVSEHHRVIRVHKVLYRYRRHSDSTELTRPAEYRLKTKSLARRMSLERRKALNFARFLSKGLIS